MCASAMFAPDPVELGGGGAEVRVVDTTAVKYAVVTALLQESMQ